VASSTASKDDSINSPAHEDHDKDDKVPTIIKNQLTQLNDMATHSIAEEEATDDVAEVA